MVNRFTGIEALLYHILINSKGFHRFVQRVYCKVNGISYRQYLHPNGGPTINKINYSFYEPKLNHKFKAFRVIWWQEFKKSVGF